MSKSTPASESGRPAQHDLARTLDLAGEAAALAYAVIARSREIRAAAQVARRDFERVRARIKSRQGAPPQ